jgi:hypothetical protein
MKNIQSLKGENLGTKEILAICEMVLKSGDSIYHTLPALTKGLQLTKQPVTPRLIQDMGDLVVLISKSNKDQKTLLSETKKILSSYRGLIDEEALSLISEGAALITPDGLSNIMAIEAGHGIPFESVSQLKELVSTLKECHNLTFLDESHKQKLQSTLSKESIAVIEHQVTINDLRRLVFSQYNRYGRDDFDRRIQNWGNKNLPPALKVTSDREFEIRAKAGTPTLRVIPGKELNQKLFEAVSDKVIADSKKIEDRLKSLYSLAGIPLPEKLPDVATASGKKEIFLLLKTMPQEKLRSALNAIKPALPVLCDSKIRVAHFGEVSTPNIKEIHDFYGSVITAYEHIDDVLTREGIKLTKDVKQVVFDNFTKPIREELDKFRFSGAKETRTVKLVGTKNIYDTFYDAIGESCLGNEDLERSDFQPIRLVDPDSGDHYGVVYAVKSEINGTPSLVLFGIEIRREYAYSISQSELMPKLIEQLGLVARENGLREVWTTTDSTRLAQYDVTRDTVMALSNGNAEINSGIQFPSHYDPATNFAKLWDGGGQR